MDKPKLIEDLGLLYPTEKSKQKTRFGIFECPYCKKLFRSTPKHIRTGNTKSCGCMKSKWQTIKASSHGHSDDSIYVLYCGIKQRCYDKKFTFYERYGERGIEICDEWKSDFMKFYNWSIENGYKQGLEIDRINNDGNYEPSNCRWVDRYNQMQNTSLIHANNTSGYRGVNFNKIHNYWVSRISCNGIRYFLGHFNTPTMAAKAYNTWVIEHNSNHPLNIIPNE